MKPCKSNSPGPEYILESFVSYAEYFSQNIGYDFTERIILLMTISGAATMESEGHTSASIFKDMQRKDRGSFNDIEFFQDTAD
jgi:hypothetical protein